MGRRRERGAAAVEFAIVLPILLLFLAGIIDFGRAMYTQAIVTNAAREGARAAVVNANASARATAAATPLTVAVAAGTCPAVGGPAANVTVTVTTDFDWILIGPATSMVGGAAALPAQLTSSATMRCGG